MPPSPHPLDAIRNEQDNLWLRLGLKAGERPLLFRETADAATDTDLAFWLVLLLSGAIATLGLTLNSTAVVIGAMLVAPLLGPLLGLSLSVAVGDGRLFVQTLATVLVAALAIVILAAVITYALPVGTVTDEIASRTKPTILDLLVAIFSGAAGAVVMASRESRLSASIPGVAVAVALVPPLGVAGFGVGTGWQWPIISGSLLLFGANLAGIVLSGLAVFLLVGMHRHEVVAVARQWHREGRSTGLARQCERLPLPHGTGLVSSPLQRILLVLAFAVLVSLPLVKSFSHFVREVRVGSAADAAETQLEADGRTLVLNRSIKVEDATSTIVFRVATKRRVADEERTALARKMSVAVGEPVILRLDQIVVPSGQLRAAADALPTAPVSSTAPTALSTDELVGPLAERLAAVRGELLLPPGSQLVALQLQVRAGGGPLTLVTYGGVERLSADAEALIGRQAARSLSLDPDDVRVGYVPLGLRPFPIEEEAAALRQQLARYPALGATLRAPEGAAVPDIGVRGGDGIGAGQAAREIGPAGLRLCVRPPDVPPGCPAPSVPLAGGTSSIGTTPAPSKGAQTRSVSAP